MSLPDILEVVLAPEPPQESLEARVRRLENREAIRKVLAAYCYFEDHHRWQEMVSLFTDDCERTLAGTLDQTVRGRDALLAACLATEPLKRSDAAWGAATDRAGMQGTSIRHLLATEMIKIEAEDATARVIAYYQIVATRGTGESFRRGSHEGTYHFDFVYRPELDRWRIKRQVIWTNHATNPLFQAGGEAQEPCS